ncbi:5'-nucleotidase C-terminal domain-containing protein [Paenibacillus sp. sptzw28]|uniref:bifunctional metallophosphatase/5'-nucleotidase n=1 Tax=Paenibacillus sp. sptzw28 TaxID=715179 RepID=UPI001C6E1330|nr:5'-nucleotidase C-terminal domain-containing protein [Paenibacillus sp. sptzw28]QYR22442.1 5'-nucleotidase C-terminal domain-containing protein [Paenibacillus sp. sptzw28]
MKRKSKFLAAVAAAGLLVSALSPMVHAHGVQGEAIAPNLVGPAYEKANRPLAETTLTIIHDTHFHGNFGQPDSAENIANYFGLANRIKSEQPNSLFIGNGDDIATSVLSSNFNGQHMIDAFNAGKLDVDTYGNHDFDMGPDRLAELVTKSQFKWVSANVIDKRTNDVFAKEQGAARFIIKEVNGVKVGITGLINEEAPEITTMGDNAIVLDPVEAMKTIIPEMKAAGANIIIVSSHLSSPDARILAEKVDGIDLIVGDHAAFAYESPEKIHDTLLWFIGDEFEYLGEINLQIKNSKIADFNYHRYALKEEAAKEGFAPDAAVKAVMDKYIGQLKEQLSVVIGKTATELDVMKSTQRQGETAIGNYVADTIREYTGSDVALINGGGIRADRVFPVGPLTKQDIMDAMPFTNYVVKIEITGKQLYQALENSVSGLEEGAGRFAQISGIKYAFKAALPVQSRIIGVKVNGKPLDPAATYTLATVDFIANGGDGYEMFKGANFLLDSNNGPLLSSLVTETIQKQETIAPKLEGRIKSLPLAGAQVKEQLQTPA